jgi:hypothetical protein
MKTLLASILGLTALTSVALAGEAVTGTTAHRDQLTQLSPAQMDQVTAGQATASLSLAASAIGPTRADVTGSGAVSTAVVGGSAPSNTSSLTASLSSSSE